MEASPESSLGQWLTATGLLSEADLVRAEERHRTTGERLPDAIVRLGYCTPEEMAQALARRFGLGYVAREEFPTSPPFLANLSPQYMPRSSRSSSRALLRRRVSRCGASGFSQRPTAAVTPRCRWR